MTCTSCIQSSYIIHLYIIGVAYDILLSTGVFCILQHSSWITRICDSCKLDVLLVLVRRNVLFFFSPYEKKICGIWIYIIFTGDDICKLHCIYISFLRKRNAFTLYDRVFNTLFFIYLQLRTFSHPPPVNHIL